jgi:hypothetical protein
MSNIVGFVRPLIRLALILIMTALTSTAVLTAQGAPPAVATPTDVQPGEETGA